MAPDPLQVFTENQIIGLPVYQKRVAGASVIPIRIARPSGSACKKSLTTIRELVKSHLSENGPLRNGIVADA
jgi:hypothetical protein